jgi:hypothetical protein
VHGLIIKGIRRNTKDITRARITRQRVRARFVVFRRNTTTTAYSRDKTKQTKYLHKYIRKPPKVTDVEIT